MKTPVYLKRNTTIGRTYIVKITEESVLTVTEDKIELEDLCDDCIEKEIGWYKTTESFMLVDATRQDFDEAYIKVVALFNEASKI